MQRPPFATIPLVQMHKDINARPSDLGPEVTKDSDFYRVSSIFLTLQGEGVYAGRPAIFVRLAGCNLGAKEKFCQGCFPRAEKVLTTTGHKRFDKVQEGDWLYALDESGQIVTTQVKKVLIRSVPAENVQNFDFDVDGKTQRLTCTIDHPIHTSNRGFVHAGDLKKSDRIVHLKRGELKSKLLSERVAASNPMKRPEVAARVSEVVKAQYASGEREPSVISEEGREKLAAGKRGDLNPMKRHSVRLASAQGHQYPKSGLENKFEHLFAELGIKATYTGNKKEAFIGDDEKGYACPDFRISKTHVIEVYDTTRKYQSGDKLIARTKRNYEAKRRRLYERHGQQVLFLTQKDLPGKGIGSGGMSDERRGLIAVQAKKLKERIVAFKRNGAKLISKSPLATGARKSIDANGEIEVVNFTCAPYNTFLVNDIHTHNCDTDFRISTSTLMSGKEISDQVGALLQEYLRNSEANLSGAEAEVFALTERRLREPIIVITGGEPFLHPNLSRLLSVLRKATARHGHRGNQVQLETNGVLFWSAVTKGFGSELDEQAAIYVVSPKASEKGGYPDLRYLEGVHQGDHPALQVHFKFVVDADPSSPHHKLPDWASALNPATLYISPMTVYKKPYEGEVSNAWDPEQCDQVQTARNYAHAAQLALAYGATLSIQQHTLTAIP